MAAAGGIVVGQRQIEPAVTIEVDEADAVCRIVRKDGVGERLDEGDTPLTKNASR